MARSRPPPADTLRNRVEARAGDRCEYCHAPQWACGYCFHIDHVKPGSRRGSDHFRNRALTCASCNLAKSAKTSGVDPVTGKRSRLFNPRRDSWDDHFRWATDRTTIEGLTPVGRATVSTLNMNDTLPSQPRPLWFDVGYLP